MVDVFDPQGEAELLLEKWGKWSQPDEVDGALEYRWGDPGNDPGSIVDAERLLCLLLAATSLDRFRLARPATLPENRVQLLDPRLKTGTALAQRIIDELLAFHRRYERDGRPVFGAGTYLLDQHGKATDPDVEVVDSFTLSVSLCLYTLMLLKSWRKQQESKLERMPELRDLAERRLTFALQGLVDSFCVAPVAAAPDEHWHEVLGDVLVGLENLDETDVGVPAEAAFFECGWTWGRLHPGDRTLTVSGSEQVTADSWADKAPSLYFSMNAIDGIVDLFSHEVRKAGILNEEQQDLAGVLQRCWELTQRYWAALAFLDVERGWRLEDLPWRTTGGDESDYWSLLVVGIATQTTDRTGRESQADVERLYKVLDELAKRSRITRRPVDVTIQGVRHPDPALGLHWPGLRMELRTRDGAAPYSWSASDFAPQLLKRTAKLYAIARSPEERRDLRSLMDDVWQHLHARRVKGSKKVPWDDVTRAFPTLADEERGASGSWYYTERVMEALVSCVAATRARTEPAPATEDLATDLLAEADYQLAKAGSEIDLTISEADALNKLRRRIEEVRDLAEETPGLAIALVGPVLTALYDRRVKE